MGMLRRFDAWAGLKLFHPPIIRFCQWTGCTQYRLHRDMWFAAWLYMAWDSSRDGDPWWWIGLILLACLLWGLRAALLPATFPETSPYWVRALFWIITALSLPFILDGRALDLADNLWILTAEYAATIANIPPREKKARRTSAKRATATI